jgi:MFS family permease
MFQVYGPILAVASGLGDQVGGFIVSAGMASMWSVPIWGALGRRIGFRRLLTAGYVATGLLTLAAAALMHASWLGALCLVLAGFAAGLIDGAGNSLFLRAVHPYERSEMTAVFISFRDAAQLGPPALFALLLGIFELPAVFVAGGLMMVAMARLTRHIPRGF